MASPAKIRHFVFTFERGVCDGYGVDEETALAQCLTHMESVYSRFEPPRVVADLGHLEKSREIE